MPTERLSETFCPWIEEALEQVAMGETITWEMGLTMIPQGTFPVVLLAIPHGLIGQDITAGLLLGKGTRTPQEELAGQLHGLVEQMRAQRTADLSQTNGHDEVPDPSSAMGIIKPE